MYKFLIGSNVFGKVKLLKHLSFIILQQALGYDYLGYKRILKIFYIKLN